MLNMNWHDPELYLFLCALACLAALLAITYELVSRRRKPPVRRRAARFTTALNSLRNRFRRKFTPGEVQRLEQRSRTRL